MIIEKDVIIDGIDGRFKHIMIICDAVYQLYDEVALCIKGVTKTKVPRKSHDFGVAIDIKKPVNHVNTIYRHLSLRLLGIAWVVPINNHFHISVVPIEKVQPVCNKKKGKKV